LWSPISLSFSLQPPILVVQTLTLSVRAGAPMNSIYIGRQPIYHRNQSVYAYELLFRDGNANRANIDDPDRATSQLIVNALTEFGLRNIVDDKLAFINLTRNFTTGTFPIPGAQSQLVLEILEDIELDKQVLAGIVRLKHQGYTIALDDFIFYPHLKPLVQIADIVKLDVLQMDSASLHSHVKVLQRYQVKLLAEKVEDHAMFQQCLDLGIDYFQGYFFCKPNIIQGKRTPANRLALLNLLTKLSSPDVGTSELEKLIAQDVTLSFRLLRYLNSSQYSVGKTIDSIKHAIMLLGLNTVRSLCYLIVISTVEDKPFELFITALIRAHMCESLAGVFDDKAQQPTYFTVGLLSVIDAMMDQSLETVLTQLPLREDISRALLQHEGKMGKALHYATAYERGEWDKINSDDISSDQIGAIYLRAIAWCKEFTKSLEQANAA
jgi:EAL and modified HD-GYP domain-containing signal transduction protein